MVMADPRDSNSRRAALNPAVSTVLGYRLAFCTRCGKRRKAVERTGHVLQIKSLMKKDSRVTLNQRLKRIFGARRSAFCGDKLRFAAGAPRRLRRLS